MKCLNRDNEKGLTLVELLIAMAISVIIITSIVVLLRYSQDAFLGTETQADIQQNARVGLDLMVRELRMAKNFVNILNSMVTFRADIQGTNDTIEYVYDPGTKRLTRNLNGVGAFPLAENVKVAGLYFKYYTYDVNGNSVITSDPAKVNRVLVNLAVESKNRNYTLAADISPRNMDPSGVSSPPGGGSGGGTVPPPGAPFLIVSAAPAAPTSVRADGIATATITATLWDANGNPWPGQSVTLTATPISPGLGATFENGSSSITGITDGGGQMLAYLKSTRCDGINFSIVGTGGGVSSTPAYARFFQGPPSLLTLEVDPAKVLACRNGSPPAPLVMKTTVLDQCSQIVADGTPVTFSANPATGATFSPNPATTANGIASTNLTRTVTTSAPNLLVSATAESAANSITVPFLAGPPYGTIILSINPNRVKADGLEQATISATVKDQCGNLVADGTTVTLNTSLGFFVGATPPNQTKIELSTVSGVVTAYLKSSNEGNADITVSATGDVLGVSGTATGSGTVIFSSAPATMLVSSGIVSRGDKFHVYIIDGARRNGVPAEGQSAPFWWAHDCTQSGDDDDPFKVLEKEDTGVFMVNENQYGGRNFIETSASLGSPTEVVLKTEVSDVITLGYNQDGQSAQSGDNTWCASVQAPVQAQVTVSPTSLSYVVNSKALFGAGNGQVLFKIKSGTNAPLTIKGITVEWTDISDFGFASGNDWSEGPSKPLLQEVRFIETDVASPSAITKRLWKGEGADSCGSPLGKQSSPAALSAFCESLVLNGGNQVATMLLDFAANGAGNNMNATQFTVNITYEFGSQTFTATIIFLTI